MKEKFLLIPAANSPREIWQIIKAIERVIADELKVKCPQIRIEQEDLIYTLDDTFSAESMDEVQMPLSDFTLIQKKMFASEGELMSVAIVFSWESSAPANIRLTVNPYSEGKSDDKEIAIICLSILACAIVAAIWKGGFSFSGEPGVSQFNKMAILYLLAIATLPGFLIGQVIWHLFFKNRIPIKMKASDEICKQVLSLASRERRTLGKSSADSVENSRP